MPGESEAGAAKTLKASSAAPTSLLGFARATTLVQLEHSGAESHELPLLSMKRPDCPSSSQAKRNSTQAKACLIHQGHTATYGQSTQQQKPDPPESFRVENFTSTLRVCSVTRKTLPLAVGIV